MGSAASFSRPNKRWYRIGFQLILSLIIVRGSLAQSGPASNASSTPEVSDPCNTWADEFSPPSPGWQLTWENDSIIGPYGTDEFYTQGLQFGYRFKPNRQPDILARAAAAICSKLAGASSPEHRGLVGTTSVFLGQHFFTPGNISDAALIPDDRAYGAWLYVGTRLELAQHFEKQGRFIKTGLYHTFELQLGITGRRAQGEWVQTNWHKLVVAPEPLGWDNQLPSEPGIQARYSMRGMVKDWRRYSSGEQRPLQLQGTIDAGTNIGTLLVEGSLGTTWRLGRNLGDPVTERLAGPAIAPLSTSNEPCWKLIRLQECYIYAGITGHAVAFNAFLDGTLFHGGHSVDKESGVYDFTWGMRAKWKRFQIDYAQIRTSREFSPVPSTAQLKSGRHGFGSLSIRCIAPIESGDNRSDLVCPAIFGALITAVAIQ